MPIQPVSFALDELNLAWQRVEYNEGCAGCDGVTIDRFGDRLDRELRLLQQSTALGVYRPLPLRRIMVEKRPGSAKLRRLLVPAVRDRVLQTAVASRLSASFEEEFLESSFAYRPGRSVDRAIARVTQLRDRGFFYVVDADITNFFDSVDQSLLLSLLATQNHDAALLPMLESWIRAEYWDGARLRKLTRGIAQGSPLSPLLANFFLNEFDLTLQKSDSHLIRYADDFLVLSRTEEGAKAAFEMAAAWLASRKLRLNQDKSRITSFAVGFHFLGALFAGEHVYIPWKGERPKGRLLHAASPMPARMLAAYTNTAPATAIQAALRKAQATVIPRVSNPDSQKGDFVSHLYVTAPGAILRKSGDRFLVEKEDRILVDLPYHKLETVFLFGNVQLTTQAMAELLDRGIFVSLFSSHGKFRGSLNPPHGKDVFQRIRQFDLHKDGLRTLNYARATIKAKIANGLEILLRAAARTSRPEGFDPLIEEITAIEARLPEAPDLASLIGLEGAAAKSYFSALMLFNLSPLKWHGRIHHPATDPINALLSLTYTLLLQELSAFLEGHGLDPCLGFLHQPDYGRPSLALDLLEPFRHPLADRFVLNLINRKAFEDEDFQKQSPNGGLFLTRDALKRFLESYERWMLAQLEVTTEKGPRKRPNFRSVLKREGENFAAVLRTGGDWHPFLWRDYREGDLACNTSSVTI